MLMEKEDKKKRELARELLIIKDTELSCQGAKSQNVLHNVVLIAPCSMPIYHDHFYSLNNIYRSLVVY